MTGFSGLVAEQGFEKYISLLVGATAAASAVVLFTYFLGFALGSLAASTCIKRGRVRRPLLAYGLLELLVGISCVAFSYSFHGVIEQIAPFQSFFGSTAAKMGVRFVFGCLLVLPTAALMGATFPLMATSLDRSNGSGKERWAHAYSANLAGALFATLITPIAVMPTVGLRGALWLCFAISILVCTTSALRSYADQATRSEVVHQPPIEARTPTLLLAASFGSGLVFFALEVIWTHLIGVVIGSSIYAFSWMLSAVLLGLLLGSLAVSRTARHGRTPPTSALFQCCALSLLLQMLLWGRVPALFALTLPQFLRESFWAAELFKLYVAAVVIVPSAAFLGLIYPKLLVNAQGSGREHSFVAGYLNASNAAGCLTGALLGVFVLVPIVGSELSLKLILTAILIFGLLFLLRESASRRRWSLAVAISVGTAVIAGISHWDWLQLTSGRGNYFGQNPRPSSQEIPVRRLPPKLVFLHEDVQGGVTTVVDQEIVEAGSRRVVRTMFTNGKFQGDDNPVGEQDAQFAFAGIPSLFVRHFDRALVIGLGTGHTAAALRHLGYEHIEVAEFASGIVGAADKCYRHINEGILSDPEVRLHLEDGRNVLLTNPRSMYDLITIEVSSIWFAGSTNLYSQEFYRLVQRRLKHGGRLQQWIQLHHIGPREIASALVTARTVFPYVGLWSYGHQGMLIASSSPLEPSSEMAEHLLAAGYSVQRTTDLVNRLSRSQLVSVDGTSRMLHSLSVPVNTDHNRWLEYATPRYQPTSFDWETSNLQFLSNFR